MFSEAEDNKNLEDKYHVKEEGYLDTYTRATQKYENNSVWRETPRGLLRGNCSYIRAAQVFL
jgi:hypothetical protein